jgi:S1-C subfamily serine protease
MNRKRVLKACFAIFSILLILALSSSSAQSYDYPLESLSYTQQEDFQKLKSEESFFKQNNHVYDAVVKVETHLNFEKCTLNKKGKPVKCKQVKKDFGSGSGFFLSDGDKRSRHLVTADHVCSLNPMFKIKLKVRGFMNQLMIRDISMGSIDIHMDDGYQKEVEVVQSSRDLDLCVMESHTKERALTLSEKSPERGHRYFNIGAPLGIHGEGLLIQQSGLYSGSKEVDEQGEFDFYSFASAPGSSGSPIMNKKGHVVGMVSRGDSQYGEITMSPVYSEAYSFLTETLKGARDE